jgi:hypothetical protein
MVCFKTVCALLFVCEAVRPECYCILSSCVLHMYFIVVLLPTACASSSGSITWGVAMSRMSCLQIPTEMQWKKLPSVVVRGVSD